MALSDEDRERIREEEWVRLQAQEDFYRSRGGLWRWRPRKGPHPGFALGAVALLFFFVILSNIADRVDWHTLLR